MTSQNQDVGGTFRDNIKFENWRKFSLSSFRDVRIIDDATESDTILGVPVIGDSLEHRGIIHGDILIIKITKHFNENNLYVWDTPSGRTAKYAEQTCAEITLHNGNGWRRMFSRSDVKMLGVVVRVERDLTVER